MTVATPHAGPPRSWRGSPAPRGGRDAVVLFVVTLLVYGLTSPGPTAYDQYGRLADALLHGSLSLPERPPHLEMAEYNGRAYFTNPPTPALLLTPFLWVASFEPMHAWLVKWNGGWNMPFNVFQTGLSWLCGALAVAFARIALGRVPLTRKGANWGAVLFGYGTVHWYHATIGSVWYLAQIVHGMFMWMMVAEWLGRARPAIMGCCLGAAFWCRMETIIAVPFPLLALPDRWLYPRTTEIIPRPRLGYLLAFAAPIAFFLALNAGYNYVRFGVFGNAAYEVLIAKGKGDPLFPKGLMDPSYWRGHVHVLFEAKPILLGWHQFPWILPGVGGLAIWATTPGFIYALRAPWDRWTLACWVGIALFIAVLFQFGGTGMTQLGYRFALDFYALLTVLTLRGMDPPLRSWHVALLAACVVINAWWVYCLNLLNMQRLF